MILDGNEATDPQKLKGRPLLFPPVFCGINPAIRSNKWTIIGHIPVDQFNYPGFISTLTNFKTGEATTWYFWSGEQSIRLGKDLPEEYKKLEYLGTYPADFIVDRIMTGIKPHEQLIMTNKEPLPLPMTKEEKKELRKSMFGKE